MSDKEKDKEKDNQAEFVKKHHSRKIVDDAVFKYTRLGEPLIIKDADVYTAIRIIGWTPEQLEAIAKFMRENPRCKLMRDGSRK